MGELMIYKVTQQIPADSYWYRRTDLIIREIAHKMIDELPMESLEKLFHTHIDATKGDYITITMSKII